MRETATDNLIRITVDGYDYCIYRLRSDAYVVNVLGGVRSSYHAALEALCQYVNGEQGKRARA